MDRGKEPQLGRQLERRKSFLSLRWLLIILGSYLTLFPRLGGPTFTWVFAFALAFAASNVICSLIPRQSFNELWFERSILIVDSLFVAMTFYLLRPPGTYLYLAFVAVFALAIFWRDLRVLKIGRAHV